MAQLKPSHFSTQNGDDGSGIKDGDGDNSSGSSHSAQQRVRLFRVLPLKDSRRQHNRRISPVRCLAGSGSSSSRGEREGDGDSGLFLMSPSYSTVLFSNSEMFVDDDEENENNGHRRTRYR